MKGQAIVALPSHGLQDTSPHPSGSLALPTLHMEDDIGGPDAPHGFGANRNRVRMLETTTRGELHSAGNSDQYEIGGEGVLRPGTHGGQLLHSVRSTNNTSQYPVRRKSFGGEHGGSSLAPQQERTTSDRRTSATRSGPRRSSLASRRDRGTAVRQAAEGLGRILGHVTPRGTDVAKFDGEWSQMQEAALDAATATVARQGQEGTMTE